MKTNFAIIGGGIGGLSTAIVLQRMGYDVKVFEKASTIKPIGAGLGIGANAIKALEKMGISDEVLKVSKVLDRFVIYDENGKVITETDSKLVSKRFSTDNVTIHRASLHQVLVNQLQEGTIELNKKCDEFIKNEDGVTVHFQDQSEIFADYVIAADGIHSIFRKKLIPTSTPRYAGYTCWRAVIDEPKTFDSMIASETWGGNGRFGIVPIGQNQVYWFACIKAPFRDTEIAQFGVKDLQSYFENYHQPIPEILANTPDDFIIHNDICDIKPIRKFAHGNIVLLGDAAHATTPNMGQGACMAIEDAIVLENCIKKFGELKRAFIEYDKLRVERTAKIMNMSRKIGVVAQLKNPILTKVRNKLLSYETNSSKMKRLEFLYNVNLD